jgi:hypothetical protein
MRISISNVNPEYIPEDLFDSDIGEKDEEESKDKGFVDDNF